MVHWYFDSGAVYPALGRYTGLNLGLVSTLDAPLRTTYILTQGFA